MTATRTITTPFQRAHSAVEQAAKDADQLSYWIRNSGGLAEQYGYQEAGAILKVEADVIFAAGQRIKAALAKVK